MTRLPESRDMLNELDRVVDLVPDGVSADVRLSVGRTLTMRYANSAIHQPTLQFARTLSVRVEDHRRLGTALSSDLSKEGIRRVIDEAARLARVAPRERRFPGFPSAQGPAVRPTPFSDATAHLTPERTAALARASLRAALRAVPAGRVSGVMNAGGSVLAVGTTKDLRRITRRSFVHGTALVDRPDLDPPPSGWSEGAHWSIDRFDAGRIGKEAGDRMPKEVPRTAPPGTYPVVLRGSAVQELLSFFGYLGFSGHGEEEGWSCLRGRRGRKLFPHWLDLVDDGRSTATLPFAFDYEGFPKRATPLVENGRAGAAVTDLVTAGRLRRRPSGHALPPEAPWGDWGPVPGNLVFRGGSASEDDLAREVGNGILVTRFHYVRVVHPGRGEITGMTRDGTYRIEGGQVVGPVRNLRFTDSVVRALQGALAAGKEVRCYSDEAGSSSTACPALAVGAFRFTSGTKF